MSGELMRERNFAPLFWTQFLGAFNDNLVKNALAAMVMFTVGASGEAPASLVALAGVMLVAPFFLFSGLAGEIADYRDKAKVARWVKGGEIGTALIAFVGFVNESVATLMAALFLTGTLSTLFGPVKYGILPQHLGRSQLMAANARIEAGTFVAILLGTVLGGALGRPDPWMAGAVTVAVAIAAYAASLLIPAAPPILQDRPDPNFIRSTVRLLKELSRDRSGWGPAVAISWFWAIGIVLVSLIFVIVQDYAANRQSVATLFLALFTIGIGVGSMAASAISGGRIVRTLVPIGSFLLGLFAVDLVFALRSDGVEVAAAAKFGWIGYLGTIGGLRVSFDLFAIAASGGLLAVPAFAALQEAAPPGCRARWIAANNVLNAAFMIIGSAAFIFAQITNVSSTAAIAIIAIANLAAIPVLSHCMDAPILRELVFILMRIMYRVEVRGLEHLEQAGPRKVIAINHVSLADAALIMSILGPKVVFAIDTDIARRWWVRPFLSFVRTYSIDPTRPLAIRTLTSMVKEENTLAIFPEGRITVTGADMKVYDGTAMIAYLADAQVVPVRISGLEQSPFSYLTREKAPKRLFPKVVVEFFPASKLSVEPTLVGRSRRRAAGRALQDLMSEARMRTLHRAISVPEAVLRAARKSGGRRVVIEDAFGSRLTYSKLLTSISTLARWVNRKIPGTEPIGVILPNTAGSAAVILGIMASGRIPAILNFTAGSGDLVAACRVAGIRTVLMSPTFVEKAKLGAKINVLKTVVDLVDIETVRGSIRFMDKIVAYVGRYRNRDVGPDNVAAILFTSGSEGGPKGVALTHSNLLSNVAQVTARFDFSQSEHIFNALPVFHAFGLTAGLILPVVSGMRTFLYPSPTHYKTIAELVYQKRCTALFGTDVLLKGYARVAHPYDFSSLRYVVAGAEKVRDETRAVWMEKFGLRILEGYGITEGSPVIAVNTPFDSKAGSVGRILPGIEYRLVSVPGITEGARLLVRGPNVMKGYLHPDNPGEMIVPPLGWHDTGDIVTVDSEGFVTIKGRAKRFAKIGGEMVSLAAVEGYIGQRWPDHNHVAVALPDPRRGERIVLLTTRNSLTREQVVAAARAAGVSDFLIPSDLVHVDAVPLLGTGKVDFASAQRIAAESSGSEQAA